MPSKLTKEELALLEESGYSKKAIRLYVDQVNVGTIRRPDIVETYAGPCGDIIRLHLEVNRNEVIEDAKFHYLGCPGSAASTSAMINLAIGKTIAEAKKLTEDDILQELGGLPIPKLDCPKLAIATLKKAIMEYEKKKGKQSMRGGVGRK